MSIFEKIYRGYLWLAFAGFTAMLIAAFISEPPIPAGEYDIMIYKVSDILLFGFLTAAHLLKLLVNKSFFKITGVLDEIMYWVAIILFSIPLYCVPNALHTDEYKEAYDVYQYIMYPDAME